MIRVAAAGLAVTSLADRFKLRFHRESRELPIYALLVDQDGPKLKPHEARSAGDPGIDQAQDHFPQTTWRATIAPVDFLRGGYP